MKEERKEMQTGGIPQQHFEKKMDIAVAGGVGKYCYDNVADLKKNSEALVSMAKKKKMSY